MSLFTDALEALGLDPSDLEPDEIKAMCRDPVFRAVARYCDERHPEQPLLETDESKFDRDELGIDPEEDAEDA